MTLTQKIAVTVTAIAASLVVAVGVTAGIRHYKGLSPFTKNPWKFVTLKGETQESQDQESQRDSLEM